MLMKIIRDKHGEQLSIVTLECDYDGTAVLVIDDFVFNGTYNECFDIVVKNNKKSARSIITVWTHSINVLFQYLRNIYDMECFAKSKSDILKIKMVDYNIQIRSTQHLTGITLKDSCELYDIGYNVYSTRNLIKIYYNQFIKTSKIPLTKTSILKKEIEEEIVKWYLPNSNHTDNFKLYLWYKDANRESARIHQILQDTFKGGVVGANKKHLNETLECDSYDMKSAYLYNILALKYPVTALYECDINEVETDDYCYLYYAEIRLCQLNKDINIPCLSSSYCEYDKREVILDANGYIQEVYDVCRFYCTKEEYEQISRCYTREPKLIRKYKAKADYLPDFIRDYVAKLYNKKETETGLLRAITKQKANSVFGLSSKKTIFSNRDEYVNGKWQEQELDIIEQLNKLNRGNIFSIAVGYWITSYQRSTMLKLIYDLEEEGIDVYYTDTDCIKVPKGKCKEVISEFNKSRRETLQQNYKRPLAAGLGEFIYEPGKSGKLRMLGSKIYATQIGNDIELTIAGLSQDQTTTTLDSIEDFAYGIKFENAKHIIDMIGDTKGEYRVISRYVPYKIEQPKPPKREYNKLIVEIEEEKRINI